MQPPRPRTTLKHGMKMFIYKACDGRGRRVMNPDAGDRRLGLLGEEAYREIHGKRLI